MANDVQDGKALPNFDYSMMDACKAGDLEMAKAVFNKAKIKNGDNLSVSQQESEHGLSPLMVAAQNGHLDICKFLITEGAPWNACSKVGKCAGNYATENEHWEVVNFLVDAGTKAELILSASIRLSMMAESSGANAGTVLPNSSDENKLVEHEPCTKPDYLERNVRYNDDNTLLLDDDDDAVMMEWERPLMDAHASVITSGAKNRRILNVGFGLGIIDKAIQKYDPALHVIMEAHPLVYKKMIQDGWDKKSNVRICFGKWQDELPKLIEEGIIFDGIFYDTYGEHFTDLEDFHNSLPRLLSKPDGIYSFFNGLAPDNLFFHGVGKCQDKIIIG